MNNKYTINITKYPETIVAECTELPLVVEGKTKDEVIVKMDKIIQGYLDIFPEK